MDRRLVAVAFGALLLAPLAAAADPAPQPWSAANVYSRVTTLAMARDSTAIAAGLAAPTTTTPVTPPTALPGTPTLPAAPCATTTASPAICTDLAILEFDTGFARNGTPSDSPSPRGVTHVAVSRDGRSIASIGVDGAERFENRTLDFYHRAPNGNWTAAPYARSFALGQDELVTPVGLAVSDDGRRVIALLAEPGNYSLRGWTFGGTSLDASFELRAPGTPRALAAAGDMSRILIAGQFPEGNFTYGGGYILPFGQGDPLSSFFDRSVNNSDVSTAAISRDGFTLAIGGSDGRAHLFRGGTLNAPTSFNASAGAFTFTVLNEDGSRFAVAQNTTLTHFNATNATPIRLWNATVPGTTITGLAMDRLGATVVASASGAGGGVYAYDESSNVPVWDVATPATAVAMDAKGDRIAYATSTFVGGVTIPRALTMNLATGGKVAAQREIATPGTQTYEVTLLNEGVGVERVVIEEGAPEINVVTEPRIVVVRPGASVRVNVTVSVEQPLPGPRVFNITARSITSGIVDNVTLSLTPKPTLDVKLILNETDVLAEAGRTSEVLLTIFNNGTSDSSVEIRALQTVSSGALWDLKLSETSLTALRGTRTSVKVSMTPPTDVGNGTSSTVQFTLEGQDIFDTARVTFRVNPDLKVEVNASGVTKFIEPGKSGSYNVTVTNTGSLPRAFEVYFAITESNDRNWGVDMSTQTLRLEPLQKKVFQVRIVAPADAQPNERVSVLVSAKSIPERPNETAVIDNVTLFGVAVPLKITTTTTPDNGIPFLAPLAIIATAFLAAFSRRRRDP